MSMNKSLFESGPLIDLPAILTAREERFHLQQKLLGQVDSEASGSLLLMTMAIPGPIKTNDRLNQVFDEMVIEVRQTFNDEAIVKDVKREKETGFEYYLLSALSPREMKELMVKIEENHPLGRLFDLDVLFLNEEGHVEGTSRTQLGLPVRKCFICDRPAKECGRSRRHSVEELQQKISQEIIKYQTR